MQPTIPGFIDVRSREELQAAAAADAAITLAQAKSNGSKRLGFGATSSNARKLFSHGHDCLAGLGEAQLDVTTNEAALASVDSSWAFGVASAQACGKADRSCKRLGAEQSQLLHPDTCTGYGPRAQDHPRQRSRRCSGFGFARDR
jgi:hypothetical protein